MPKHNSTRTWYSSGGGGGGSVSDGEELLDLDALVDDVRDLAAELSNVVRELSTVAEGLSRNKSKSQVQQHHPLPLKADTSGSIL